MTDYIEQAERVLEFYQDMKLAVENMDRQIRRLSLSTCPRNMRASVIDETGVRGSRNDNTGFLFNNLLEMQENRELTVQQLREIDETLEAISRPEKCEYYGRILRLWYIEGKTKERIAELMNYSEKSVYNKRKLAIEKFSVQMFGSAAL